MNQYKISLHYNIIRLKRTQIKMNRTLIWDKEERPIQINRLVKKKIIGRLAGSFINLKTKNNRAHTLKELMTTHLGRQWIQSLNESKVGEYETKP
jgi:hypothetical protein